MFGMSLDYILSSIDAEISRLNEARALLAGGATGTHDAQTASTATAKPRRKMSAEARKRMATAQRKRWAARKKSAK